MPLTIVALKRAQNSQRGKQNNLMMKLHTMNPNCTGNITYFSEYGEVDKDSDKQEIEEIFFLRKL